MNKKLLTDLINDNLSQKQISEKTNKSPSTVVYWLKKYNLKTNKARTMRSSIVWKISKEDLIFLVNTSNSLAEVLRKLGYNNHLNSALYRPLKKRLKDDNIKHTHMNRKYSSVKITKYTKEEYIEKMECGEFEKINKKKLIECDIIKHENCDICGINRIWNNLILNLHLDHIDGNPKNNVVGNLRFICPNCHTQTKTYCVGNRKIKENKKCLDCGKNISRVSERCGSCAATKFNVKKFEIEKDDILKLVCERKLPFVKIGELYGVSDNAIRKRCVKFGIDPKTRKENKQTPK